MAKTLGKRLPSAQDAGFKQLLVRFAVDRSEKIFSLHVIPIVLCRFGVYFTADDWNQVEEKLRQQVQRGLMNSMGQSTPTNQSDDAQSSYSGTDRVDTDSQGSSEPSALVPIKSQDQLDGLCELSTSAILRKCVSINPDLYSSLTLREQLWHIDVRDVAIARLRQEASQAREWDKD